MCGELAQAPHAIGEHEHLFLAGDPGQGLGDDAAQQRQAVAAAAHRVRDQPLADERLRQRRLGMGERLGVDGRVQITPDVPEDQALSAGQFRQRLLEQTGAGLQALQFAQRLQQPAVGLAAAGADRLEQLGKRGVGVERQRLGGRTSGIHACMSLRVTRTRHGP